ncbi:MAG: M48 family metalloprotease [Acidobacteriaceae bacterium]|nr:M48 family metalloprotease [Acidobacteriaceae bacterium]
MRSFRIVALLLVAGSATALAASGPELVSVNLSSPMVIGGSEVHGTVTLNSAAPYDVQVSLAADPANAAKIPASVTVPAGSKDASFAINTLPRTIGPGGGDAVITVYGNYGVTKRGSLTVLPPVSFEQMIDRVVERERTLVSTIKSMHPLAETYIQDLREDKNHNVQPVNDHYFLGRLDFHEGPQDELFQNHNSSSFSALLNMISAGFTHQFLPRGFAQMAMLDGDFQKSNYNFTYVRQEFLGEARCLVIDIQPKDKAPSGLFTGRIWVEDREFNIVRFNGTYSAHSRYTYYLHFDSWRLNVQPHLWLPAYIYIEESGTKLKTPPFHSLYFKAQTRLWAYDPESLKHNDEFTGIKLDSSVDDHASIADKSPVQAQRLWERMAEDNAVDHLQKIGLLAPRGEVDTVLQTVTNNLIITNKLEIEPDVRCRVLLTTPLESFTIGHTIVVSRGLLDVLPDESSLAMVIAHELSHIALGHRVSTNLAFADRFLFPDLSTFQHLDFARSPTDEEAADKKGMELLANSPYKDKLANAGLFLKALQDHASLSNLIRPHLGNRMRNHSEMRMAALLSTAPALEKQRIDQIAALPMGGRIKLSPWNDQLYLMKLESVALLSPQEKMPFEVAPFFPYVSYSASAGQAEVAEIAAKP